MFIFCKSCLCLTGSTMASRFLIGIFGEDSHLPTQKSSWIPIAYYVESIFFCSILQGSPSGLTLPGFFYFLTFVNTRAVSSQTFFSLCPRAGLPCLGVLTPTFPKLPKCRRALPDSLRSYSPRKGSHIPPASSYHPSLLGTPTAPEISWHGAEFCLPNITVRSAGAMPSACFEFNFR